MATDPSNPTPPPPPGPPPAPPPGASRDEWRAWRHQNRDYMRAQWMQGGPFGPWGWHFGWGWFWGVALVLIGAYYLLNNLGLLSWLRGDVLWPILIILLGVMMLLSRGRGWWRW
jgi:cell wall-active antibiotic response 4TMS protein YvqF